MKRRACAIAAGILFLLSWPLSRVDAEVSREVPTAPFEAGLYALGYDVFLANNNPDDAFAVAEKAVSILPGDPVWRRRAAQSAEWSGRPVLALEHWRFLAVSLSDAPARREALRIARMLRDSRAIIELLKPLLTSGSKDILLEYVAACESLGLPGDAIAALERQRRGKNVKFALEQLSRLYEETGRPDDAMALCANWLPGMTVWMPRSSCGPRHWHMAGAIFLRPIAFLVWESPRYLPASLHTGNN